MIKLNLPPLLLRSSAGYPSQQRIRTISILSHRHSPSRSALPKPFLQGPTHNHNHQRPPVLAWYTTTTPTKNSPPPPPPDMAAEPTGLIAKSGIELLTTGTPNGVKASILLEELKDAYGLEYTYQAIDISKNTQKQAWFTAVNPNGRIPAIVDHDRSGFAVFEGAAILSYLARHYDPRHLLSFPPGSDDHSVAEQWIAWQHGGLGPMQGQANHFLFVAKENPWGVQRYVGETERLYGVLDKRLSDRDYVAGPDRGRYSIADIALVGWVNAGRLSGLDTKQFPSVYAWLDRCLARPATKRGLEIPSGPSKYGIEALAKLEAEGDQEFLAKDKEKREKIAAAKAQYNYKYASP
ncbi:hypothetical protein RB601_009338 [Gaeumannomyces tritici]